MEGIEEKFKKEVEQLSCRESKVERKSLAQIATIKKCEQLS